MHNRRETPVSLVWMSSCCNVRWHSRLTTDSVCVILAKPFSQWYDDDKKDFLNNGRYMPELNVTKTAKVKDKSYVRHFQTFWYSDYECLCGSYYLNKLFCFPCLVIGVKTSVWNGNVIRALRKHEGSAEHIHCAFKFAKLKNLNIIESPLKENSRLYINNNISKCRIFFATVTGIPTFFRQSPKRTYIANTIIGKRIPTTVSTCWTSNSKIINVIYNEWDILKFVFSEIMNDRSSDQVSIRQSEGFLKKFEDFAFLFLTVVFKEIFGITDVLYNVLQKKSMDIGFCISEITNTVKLISNNRS